jgi:hypothetical protein
MAHQSLQLYFWYACDEESFLDLENGECYHSGRLGYSADPENDTDNQGVLFDLLLLKFCKFLSISNLTVM